MSGVTCPQEELVIQAVLTGAWPHRADEALVAHAVECGSCREVVAITALLHDDSERARFEVPVPAAGQVWWRAAVRARLESTHTATRPMTWMHALTGAIFVGVVLAVLTATWPMVMPLATRMWANWAGLFPTTEAASAVANSVGAIVAMGLIAAAVLVLTPLAVYYVLSDD